MNRFLKASAIVLALAAAAQAGAANVSFTGATYFQNFDGLPATPSTTTVILGKGPHSFSTIAGATGLDGWYFGNPLGSSANTEFRAQDGSLGSGGGRGVISFGTTSSAERALGAVPTSNQINRFGVLMVNNSGATINALDVAFTGEQWRIGDTTSGANTLGFAYGVATSINDAGLSAFAGLSFSSVVVTGPTPETALNGNSPANQASRSGTLTGLNWGAGQTLAMRWTMNDLSGQDDGLGIDNFSVATPVPEPEIYAMLLAGLCAIGVAARRRTKQ
jgi:hypothetical protein